VSVVTGRAAVTGRDPPAMMAAAVELLKVAPTSELTWASPRELHNIFHAYAISCHVVTVTDDILKKLSLVSKNFDD
jgi:transaldolase